MDEAKKGSARSGRWTPTPPMEALDGAVDDGLIDDFSERPLLQEEAPAIKKPP